MSGYESTDSGCVNECVACAKTKIQKMEIDSKTGLLKHLEKDDKKKAKKNMPSLDKQEFEIKNKTFEGYTFTKEFVGLDFKRCKFIECKFENIWGFFMLFHKCSFENCEFKNSRFSHLEMYWDDLEFKKCLFRNVQWDEGALFNISFEECNLYGFSMLGMVPLSYVCFTKCSIENSQFQSLIYYKDPKEIDDEVEDLVFKNCEVEFSYFNGVDLRNSFFIDTGIYRSSFINCEFKTNTIRRTTDAKFTSYASIDFQSLIKSDVFDPNILKNYFKIQEPDIKNIIKNITSKIDFKTVFISYSFKDKAFANLLNTELNKRGIKTFIWEKDAPGGHTLEEIMSGNITKHDKVLFIASENSIKSKACQFELSEGRKKQEATWETIFFPIHIDNFLFSVKKDQIRPISKADEYWENIQELKRVNSMDFSKFSLPGFKQDELNDAVTNIIKELKL